MHARSALGAALLVLVASDDSRFWGAVRNEWVAGRVTRSPGPARE
jgi:hypothetical protein